MQSEEFDSLGARRYIEEKLRLSLEESNLIFGAIIEQDMQFRLKQLKYFTDNLMRFGKQWPLIGYSDGSSGDIGVEWLRKIDHDFSCKPIELLKSSQGTLRLTNNLIRKQLNSLFFDIGDIVREIFRIIHWDNVENIEILKLESTLSVMAHELERGTWGRENDFLTREKLILLGRIEELLLFVRHSKARLLTERTKKFLNKKVLRLLRLSDDENVISPLRVYTIASLAETMAMPQKVCNKLLRRLERLGFIRREFSSPADTNSFNLRRTNKVTLQYLIDQTEKVSSLNQDQLSKIVEVFNLFIKTTNPEQLS